MTALGFATTSLAGTELARIRRLAADTIRALAMDAVQKANSGHPGMPMGMADAAVVLWTRFLKHDPADPLRPDRDSPGGHSDWNRLGGSPGAGCAKDLGSAED